MHLSRSRCVPPLLPTFTAWPAASASPPALPAPSSIGGNCCRRLAGQGHTASAAPPRSIIQAVSRQRRPTPPLRAKRSPATDVAASRRLLSRQYLHRRHHCLWPPSPSLVEEPLPTDASLVQEPLPTDASLVGSGRCHCAVPREGFITALDMALVVLRLQTITFSSRPSFPLSFGEKEMLLIPVAMMTTS
ncbi:hypothetical protein GUJ93_ZPchr0006g45985 [Zizania palustris]|uniref:Uncharacterized protein n=1 Tax=Zizania palustris TaxID=103762 RepID=A0A8J5TAS8_ZIZPA|nr:hypothetical protein GUJ93_ZPchr0006g45985 [Zizania palustris]